MKRCMLLLPIFAAACATSPPSWQVSNIYTAPGAPSALPAEAAGTVRLQLEHNAVTGYFACQPVQARTEMDNDVLTIVDVRYGEKDSCEGAREMVRTRLSQWFQPGSEFDVDKLNDNEMILRLRGEAVDQPSMRLVS